MLVFDGHGTESDEDRHKLLLDNPIYFRGVTMPPSTSALDESSFYCIYRQDPCSNRCSLQGKTKWFWLWHVIRLRNDDKSVSGPMGNRSKPPTAFRIPRRLSNIHIVAAIPEITNRQEKHVELRPIYTQRCNCQSWRRPGGVPIVGCGGWYSLDFWWYNWYTRDIILR